MDPIDEIVERAAAEGAFDEVEGRGRPYRVTDTGPGWWVRRKLAEIRDDEEAASTPRRPVPPPWVPPTRPGRPS